jgi:hypothetical protein
MATAATSLLGLALPVTGELSGTWGDTVNTSITALLDTAIAGTTTITSDADVTLTTTSLAANTSRQAVLLWTASGTVTRTITAPAQSKIYIVINKTGSTQSIKLVGVGPTTGVTIIAGESAVCAWNGVDFVKVSNSSGAGVFTSVTDTGLTNTRVTFAGASGLLSDSANLTWSGTSLGVTGTVAVTGALTATLDSTFSSTGALTISKGTTAQQPGSPSTGMMRYNSTTNQFEGYSGASPAWKSIGGSALSNDTSTASNLYPVFAAATTGTAENLYTSNALYLYKPSTGELSVKAPVASNGIFVNSTTVSSSYTIATGYNGYSVGPVTVNSGVAVTVSSGQRWLVQ